MANGKYDWGRQQFATAGVDWVNDTIKVMLVDTEQYTVNLTTHQDYNDVYNSGAGAGLAILAEATLANKTADSPVGGVLDADDVVFTAVTPYSPTATGNALIIFKDADSPGNSALLFYIDTGVSGLPVLPVGDDISLLWSNGSNRICKL